MITYLLEQIPRIGEIECGRRGSTNVNVYGARTVISLASSAPNLQGADFSGLIYVTDTSILELTTKSLPLEWMRLNGVTALTDSSISAIVKSCPYLRELELCDLPFLTATSVRDLWTYSRKLRV